MFKFIINYKFNIINILVYMLIGYIFGSIPNGYLVAKSKGVNIFEVGSCNPGSTNVGRVLGKTTGRIVFALDLLKTILPITICAFFYFYMYDGIYNVFYDLRIESMINNTIYYGNIRLIKLLVGLGAIIGHNFPIFTKFRGGKGVTATVAALFCFNAFFAISLFITFKIICKITNYVSLSSILTLIIMFLVSLFFTIFMIYPFDYYYSDLLVVITFIYMAFGIARHSSNIKKLLNGTENKIVNK